MKRAAALLGALAFAASAMAADFGHPGGPEPANLEEVARTLRADPYDVELLISFGTSKGGSAGHLALAMRGASPADDDQVYSANYYADRDPAHDKDHYTSELMVRIPKMEYLYRTASTLDPKASFGLDFGETYKRSVVGIRVYGVEAADRAALAAFFDRINEDFRKRAAKTEYHDHEVKYEYMRFNCAKTIGSAFKYGAGYKELEVKSPPFLPKRLLATVAHSNVPTDMAMKLMKAWEARGYRMEVVLYRKYPASTYVDPLEAENGPFRDLPNRFPSVVSLDFRNDQGRYQDYDNLLAMYLLNNMRRYTVSVDAGTRRLEIESHPEPMAYPRAYVVANADAEEDAKGFVRRLLFRPRGQPIGDPAPAPSR
jgi:hypothetical protein